MTDERRRDQDGLAAMSSWDAEMIKLGAEGAIDILCRGIADVVRSAPAVPSKACVRFGCASIEVEWPIAVAASPGIPPPVTVEQQAGPDRHLVRALLVGTFYRAPEPGSRPFVEIGDVVEPGQQVGIVEAMKLMNPVTADLRGRVAEIVVDDAEAVEYDQPLLVLELEARE
ncbi:biotin/lipoyl-containing protein [Amycolatopsis japonica]|uniref:acetyl-CoA carboxylase biotin carboxyl carrier protein n=1 Tax=Amycolatopsis japonica TaxID=208439 RepID=UPI0033289E47